MAEPDSSMKYSALYGEIARITKDSTANSKLDFLYGVRDFLRSYPWSFVCPVATLSVTAADTTTDVADDFSELIELPSYAASSGKGPFLEQVTSKEILDLFAMGAATGDPYRFALEPKIFAKAVGQRWLFRWYPTPSANLTLSYRYRVIHPVITGDNDYSIGGPMHNMTLIAAAVAYWEKRTGHVAGVHHTLYQEELAKSILFDQRLTAGVKLGQLTTTTRQRIVTEIGTVTES